MGDTEKPLTGNQQGSTTDRIKEEISAGGVNGCLGLDQMDWGEGKGGQFYEFWKCEPCCGEPCNPKDGVMCCIHFYCFGICTGSRLLATTVNQPWACWPHCVSMWCCPLCTRGCLRYNLRKSAGIPGNYCGDIICHWCCGCCAMAQELRSIPKSMWEWIPDNMQPCVGSVPEIKMIA